VPAGFPGRIARIVESAGGRVVWVRLLVSDHEQERRIGAADREQYHKLTSISTLRRLRGQTAGEEAPAELDIDTEHRDPSTSADRIVSTSVCPSCRSPAGRSHRWCGPTAPTTARRGAPVPGRAASRPQPA
jgi:hypothetical protein